MTPEMQTYFLALNPRTENWCISKTKDIAWTTSDTVILDTGTFNPVNAIEIARQYCRDNPGVAVLNS